MNNRILALSAASLLMATSAFAETQATASTDLNVRSGPGPMFDIVGFIPADGAVTVDGCLETANWCKVTHEGVAGWSYGDYLTTKIGENAEVLYENREKAEVATLVYEDNTAAAAAGVGTVGAIIGGLIAGPPGAALGLVLGAGVGDAAAPDPTVTAYVTDNPVDPIYLDGEVVVGAGVPENVTVYEIPDTEFSYVYVNGLPVVINVEDRKIVHIIR